jgi:hypothetical protein
MSRAYSLAGELYYRSSTRGSARPESSRWVQAGLRLVVQGSGSLFRGVETQLRYGEMPGIARHQGEVVLESRGRK